ncbi:TldD/PmbA family protein [Desulfothermobacter acidiphilus]|uniref:TldD/PmbA family protein n=1 Tax=Desulfothermobacter acidiphilus TaxID=1938353 RepID=UPI003F8BC9D6
MFLRWERSWLEEVLARALARGGDYADIYLEERQSTLVTLEDRRVERVHVGVDNGVGVRVLQGENTVYAYSNDCSYQGLLHLAEQVSRAVAHGKATDLAELRREAEGLACSEDIPLDAKVEVVQRADRAAREFSPLVKQVLVSYGDVRQEVVMATSTGDLVEDQRCRLRLTVNAIAAEGGVIQTGFEALGSTADFTQALDSTPPEQLAQVAARRAAALVQAPPAPAGEMPVVLAGEAGGTMVHEACGHGLEADLVQKGLSVYKDRMGEQVAAEAVTVIDDATLPGKYGSYRYDDEGVKARPVVLIERGVLKEYLYDRRTALKEGRSSNGHGRRESYQHKPIPRMANTYIAPGEWDPEAIIREVKEGLLVRKMGGGQVNTANGDFVFEVAEGYLIRDGEVGPMVRGATITGNGPEVLRQVAMVGRDLGFTVGTCGKDGQGVPVSDAQPTLLIPKLVVGGLAERRGGKS